MRLYDEIDKRPSRADQIKVGVTMLVGFGVLGMVQFFLRHRVHAGEALWGLGGLGLLVSLTPQLGRWLHIGWMGLGVTIGIVTQPIVMILLYVLLFVPLGLVFRAVGRDMMKRKLLARAASYWEPYEESDDALTYFRQY